MRRMEVRVKASNVHLGHVFDNGPNPDRARYCINLRFVPKNSIYIQRQENLFYLKFDSTSTNGV
ncbi:peptide-methionine (R)-S-oxide reductase [Peribacillus asahii]|uniref:peptide-methionine (R)-S-oxide reductase n=1 Tax=Peribacillus asahii TaxID=228899 RepID=UPI00382FF870